MFKTEMTKKKKGTITRGSVKGKEGLAI